MAKLEILTDDFNDAEIDTDKWSDYDSNATIAEAAGKLAITLADSTAGSNYAGLASVNAYDLSNSAQSLKILEVPNQSTNAQFYFQANVDANNNVEWLIENGTIYAKKKVGGVFSTVGSNTFDWLTYRFLRIREENGTVYWEYSTDGIVWDEFITADTPFDVTAVYPEIGGGTYQSEDTPGNIHFDDFNIVPDASDVEKFQLFKVFRQGVYIGLMRGVKNPFKYAQDINSAGPGALDIEIQQSADVSGEPPSPLLDENGDPLLDENGDPLLAESADQVVGNSRSDILFRNGNDLEIWEYCKYYPNGKRVFNGKIKNWRGIFGGDGDIKLKVYYAGDDLENFLVVGETLSSDVSQTSEDSSISLWNDAGWRKVGQTWLVGAGVTNLGAIDLKLRGSGTPYNVTIKVYNNVTEANTGTLPQATINRQISSSTPAVYRFTLPNALSTTESTSYFYTVESDAPSGEIYIYYKGSNVYADGAMYISSYGGGSGGGLFYATPDAPIASASDLYFETYSDNGATTAIFEDFDPSTEMIKPSMDNYIAAGGTLSYDDADIEASGESVEDYTLITARMSEMFNVAQELLPYNFYWTVDIGLNKLKVKASTGIAEHVLVRGLHINQLELSASSENIINKILFIGGLIAGSNLYRKYLDNASIDDFGVGLDIKTDNRVVTTSVADQIGTTRLPIANDEEYQTVVTIPDGVADLSEYKLGQMIGFRGFGPLVDSLLLQIVRIEYNTSDITLSLGKIPPRQISDIKRLERNLEKVLSVDNPDAPS